MSTVPRRRLLLVEDDPDIARVARLALEMSGFFDVDVCASGEEALRELEATAPAAVLLDVMMPAMDGPTTYARLRELPHGGAVPVIFMTARAQPEEVRRYVDLGAIGVIAKPFDPMALADEVRGLLASAGVAE